MKLSVAFDNDKIPARSFEIFNVLSSLFSIRIGCFGRRIKNEKITCLLYFFVTYVIHSPRAAPSVSKPHIPSLPTNVFKKTMIFMYSENCAFV